MQLLEKVGQAIRERKLFRRGQRILVAVSGGVDSLVLLDLLHTLAAKQKWQLAIAHYNHQLRGRSSDADERLVRMTARRLGLPYIVGRRNVRASARSRKISIEMAARELRHDFLARTARKLSIPTIALAHHVDDQVELFFLRLFRGSGGEGLSGMTWHGPSPADPRITLVRPLLEQTKAAVMKFAAQNEILFRQDASNKSEKYQRNQIRHRLVPFLKKEFQPLLDQAVWRTMEIVGAETDFVGAAADKWLRTKRRSHFKNLPVAMQRRILQQQLLNASVKPGFDLIEQLRTQAGVPVFVGQQQTITRETNGSLRLTRQPQKTPFQSKAITVVFEGRVGQARFSGTCIRWQIERKGGLRRPIPVSGRESFDADLVGRQAVLRHWQPGDRFQPIGMEVAVKLQDLFVNAKVPAERRRTLIVATAASGEIFWVEGLRIGERFKLSVETKRRLQWKWAKTA